MFLINILLVDDHKLFAKSLAIALEEYEEIEEFHYITQLLDLPEMIKSKKIDIVLMDINLGKLSTDDGLSIARGLKKNAPDAKIIMLTGYDLPVYKYEARQMGASGFLNKNISPDQLVDALLAVNQNQTCFPAEEALIIEERAWRRRSCPWSASGRSAGISQPNCISVRGPYLTICSISMKSWMWIPRSRRSQRQSRWDTLHHSFKITPQ